MSDDKSMKIGTSVKLISGGPIMSVEKTHVDSKGNSTGRVTCQWFAGKKLESGIFPINSLDVVVPEPAAK